MSPQQVANELIFEQWSAMGRDFRTASVAVQLSPLLRLHMRVAERPGATSLLVLMPAAQSRIERGQLNPLFSRWSWIGDYPRTHVIAISDPALYYDGSLSAAWFLSPDIDVLREIANVLQAFCAVLSLRESSVLVYGSSLGGYGALGLASLLEGARAVSEIPQLDLERWPVPAALRALEEGILQRPLSEHRREYPEQVDVLERFRQVGRVPNLHVITNSADPLFADHLRFIDEVSRLSSEQLSVGRLVLTVDDGVSGHQVLDRRRVERLLSPVLQEVGAVSNG